MDFAWNPPTGLNDTTQFPDEDDLIRKHIQDLLQQVPDHIKIEPWITATLQNGWTGTLQYAKNNLGFVTVKGNITSGTLTALTLLATLPVGYRPINHLNIPVITPANSGYCFLWVNTDGRLLIPQGSWSFSGEYGFEITFYAG